MASPPFGINTAVPADNDIVSQFPAVNRSDKDQLQSWIEVDHDTNGHHTVINMVNQGSIPATPSAGIVKMLTDGNNNVLLLRSDGVVYYLGPPPGTVSFYAGSAAPAGWVFANGSAVSRTGTTAILFSILGTTFGVGDGSTTFNLPDIRGRVIAGVDGGIGRLTSAGLGTAAILGAVGTATETHVLLASETPNITSSGANTIVVGPPGTNNALIYGSTLVALGNGQTNSSPGAVNSPAISSGNQWQYSGSLSGSNSISVTSTNTGGTAHTNVQPTIVLNAIIKI